MLAWLLLDAQGAPAQDMVMLVGLLFAAFGGSFQALARRPERVLIGYKG